MSGLCPLFDEAASINSNSKQRRLIMKKLFSLLLILSLVHATSYLSVVSAKSSSEEEARLAEKVKSGIARLGTGTDARVKLKLRDGRKIEGYISQISDESFEVMNAKTNTATTVLYPQVKQVKGNNLSSGVKFAIGAAVVVVLLLILFHGNHDF
jgi:VIT1/CCC1 family predicted Fe2+/Mn2+ transporter